MQFAKIPFKNVFERNLGVLDMKDMQKNEKKIKKNKKKKINY